MTGASDRQSDEASGGRPQTGDTDRLRADGGDRSQSGGDDAEREANARRRIEAALREVRREGWKAAVLTSLLEATALFLAVNLLLTAASPAWLPARFPIPAAAIDAVGSAVGRDLGRPGIPGTAAVAGGVWLVAFAAAVGLRVRRPLVEQFEAVNPAVAEELRTARDAVAADADSRMAVRLYEDVLVDLRQSSGAALVSTARLTATTAIIVALSVASVQVAVADLALFDGGDDAAGPVTETPEPYEGLEDGDEVLGDREDVEAGENNETAQVESTGGDRELNESREFPPPESGAGGDGGNVESQQAGYAQPEQVDDAELVREYNHRIREEEDD